MITYHKKNIATFVGAHQNLSMLQSILQQRVTSTAVPPVGDEFPETMMVGL